MHRSDLIDLHQQADQALCEHRSGDPAAVENLIRLFFCLLSQVARRSAQVEPFGSPGEAVAFDPALHEAIDGSQPSKGQTVYVAMRGFLDLADDLLVLRLGGKPTLVCKAGIEIQHPFAPEPPDLPTSILDVRVPQPGREADYGVPLWAATCAGLVYSLRNEVPDEFVGRLDELLIALYRPWIRKAE